MLEPSGLGSLRFQNSSRKTTNGAVYGVKRPDSLLPLSQLAETLYSPFLSSSRTPTMEFWGKDKLLSVSYLGLCQLIFIKMSSLSHMFRVTKKKERYNLFTHVFGSLVYDASLRKSRRGVSALLYATVDDKKLLLGTLSQDISFDHLLFDREFELSHTLERGSVHFTGYKSKVSTKSKPASDDDDEEAFVEMVCSAKQIKDLMYPSDPDDLLLTKQDLENLVPEKSTKVLTTAHSYPREDPDLTDSDEDFLSPTLLIMNIDMDSTKADITNFFKDNCSLQVRIVQLVSTVDEESKKTKLEAHIEFRSNQELKLARKLNGHLMGKSRIFFDRTLGSLHVFFISGFNRDLREDDLKRQIEKKFKTCGALKKIILPKEQENLLGYVRFGYIVMNTTSEETVLSMDSSIMGDEAISVKSVNPRGRVFKALMESEN
ncbi:BnaCnng34560D [Brassica napus]|uniref:BnaCnng34560D protein n=1 Tax=Brassica napus TaxID=3708 RepID=A0A078J7R1_BRANA|nr:BnaCnng34560D [Brassica napus]